ncbi:MAG: hypothetical protein IT378_14020 [Sandaracinaceae bacterium]|nr:hypothetical protein [Sandaracinaceae bacterium]
MTQGDPFRRPEPTPEARDAQAREASLARVERETERAIATARKRERIFDVLAWSLLAGPVTAGLLSVGLAALGVEHVLWMLCPASAGLIAAILHLAYRARLRR